MADCYDGTRPALWPLRLFAIPVVYAGCLVLTMLDAMFGIRRHEEGLDEVRMPCRPPSLAVFLRGCRTWQDDYDELIYERRVNRTRRIAWHHDEHARRLYHERYGD